MNSGRRWNMGFEESADAYDSGTQRARVWTEAWVSAWVYCPHCGAERLSRERNNTPVGDFVCRDCSESFELKAQKKPFGPRVVDGALATMNARLASETNPNLMLMSYDAAERQVRNLVVVPKQFFTGAIIEPRKPLAPTARRAGWTGCNILLRDVPASGRIEIVRDGVERPRDLVREQWRKTLFLRQQLQASRGWLIEVMAVVDAMPAVEFTLAQVYAAEERLHALYPDNNNVRPKIRQQLQVLRDAGYLEFIGNGMYRKRLS